MNLTIQLTHLIFYGVGNYCKGHLGNLNEMHNPIKELPGPRSLHSSNINKFGKNSHHGSNGNLRAGLLGGNYSAFGRADSSLHGDKRNGVFGPTGNMGDALMREHVLAHLSDSAVKGNIYAQDALDDIEHNQEKAAMKESIGALGRLDAEGRGHHHGGRRRGVGEMMNDELMSLAGRKRRLHHHGMYRHGIPHGFRGIDEGSLHGIPLEPEGLYNEESLANAVAAQEEDPKITSATNRLAALENKGIEELVNDEIKNKNAEIEGAIAAQDAFNLGASEHGAEKIGEREAYAHKAGENAAEAALKNGSSIPEAMREGSRLKAMAHEELAGEGFKKDPMLAGRQAAAMALEAGATPEQAQREGINAAIKAGMDPKQLFAEGHEEGAFDLGTKPDYFKPYNEAEEKKRLEELAQHSEANEEEAAALNLGATPVEAKAVGLQAAKRAAQRKANKEAAEIAGKEAEHQALAHGATPLEARNIGEAAAADYFNALNPDKPLQHAHEKALAQQAANEDAAAEAAAEEIVNSVEAGVPSHKVLENADSAGREAAADNAGEGAAQEALAHGATHEEADAMGHVAASDAMASGAGAQLHPDLHEAIKEEAEEAEKKDFEKEMAEEDPQKEEKAHEEMANEIKAADTQQAFGVIGTIPDDAKVVNLTKSFITLPLKTFSTEKPKNKAEVAAKNEQAALAEKLRNKITADYIPSPLNVIKGEDGYLNIPESAKKIELESATIYFPENAKEEMKNAGKDVFKLVHRYNLGERADRPYGEGYYAADASGYEMDLPSPINQSPKKVISSKDNVLDISAASGINVLSSKLHMIPWKEYAKKMRANLNVNGIMKQETGFEKEQKELENQLETLANTKKELITNPSGSQFVKLTPPLGVSEQISVEDLLKAEKKFPSKFSESGQDGISMLQGGEEKEKTSSLNIAHSVKSDMNTLESMFQKKISEAAKTSPETAEITSTKNAFNEKATEAKQQEIGEEKHEEALEVSNKTASAEEDKKCNFSDEVVKNLNDILKENSEKFSKTLGIPEATFNSNISKIPKAVNNVIFRYQCEHESEKYQEEYRKAYKDLQTIFDKNSEAMLKILGNVMLAAKERAKPARIISTRIVRKPMTRKVPVYPKVKVNSKTGKIIKPDVVSHTTIRNLKPILVEKKVLTPVKEVVIRKGPVLTEKNPPKIYAVKEHIVMDQNGNIIKKSTQRDLPANPKNN
ncbi:polar tube 3 (PTP3) protein [Tubulinosema ratisbonensis]|uniref:Polar tube 3 (PTP3) protein n=1 Tax=Tubulinosema ratisbonensis TaxID=291195 RepID=A0A437AN01_9MICR|nr:polar tube 3 (PTP3) protein [Tubulinosema ratisbonensis]